MSEAGATSAAKSGAEGGACDWYDIGCGFGWLIDEIQLWFLDMYDGILSGVASMFEAIPMPDFMVNMGTMNFPPTVLFFIDMFQVKAGLSIIVAAYTFRFILRRTPIVG